MLIWFHWLPVLGAGVEGGHNLFRSMVSFHLLTLAQERPYT